MSVTLTSLPSEIVSCVVANIESPATLCNLARCSRQLHVYTIPHLYRHVTIQEITQREQRNRRLRTLASLLIRRPDLAGLVRHFHLSGPRPSRRMEEYSPEPEDPVSPEPVQVDQTFATADNASSLSTEEKINCLEQFSPTHKSHYDLILALLLPALLKVETLVLDVSIVSNTYYLEQMIQRAALGEKPFDVQPPFEALTSLVYSHNKLNTRGTGFIASLLKLPAMQKISVGFEKPWDDEDDSVGEDIRSDNNLKDLDCSSSSVTSLYLSVYTLNAADLGRILRAPKTLKNLFYQVCPPASINFTDLRHALASQESCLESLILECAPACDTNRGVVWSMPSFIDFNTLEGFKTSAVFFVDLIKEHGRDCLINFFPPSLVHLYLGRFNARFHGLLEALERLVVQKSPQQIAALKQLILDETDSFDPFLDGRFGTRRPAKLMDLLWGDTGETVVGRLNRVAAAQGVSVDVIEASFDEDSLSGGWPPVCLLDLLEEDTDAEWETDESDDVEWETDASVD